MSGAPARHTAYTESFYAGGAEASARSASRVVAHALELLAPGPASVVDVGCGLGTWLEAFAAAGVETILGIDGDHVDPEKLRIPPERFLAADLARPLRMPLPGILPRRFDLAVSLEVAEHLEPTCAASFVETLTSLAPAVLFSAAVPRQGGTCHRNEQWPEYWAALFAARGYATVDCIRPRIWDDAEVAYYYAQNILLFAEPAMTAARPALRPFVVAPGGALARIHPRKWLEITDPRRRFLRDVVTAAPWAIRNTLARLLRRAG